jgi:hypothetical protein
VQVSTGVFANQPAFFADQKAIFLYAQIGFMWDIDAENNRELA